MAGETQIPNVAKLSEFDGCRKIVVSPSVAVTVLIVGIVPDADARIVYAGFCHPKAWVDMSLDEKSDALYEYTKDSLTQLLNNGVDVCMVQAQR